MKSKNSVKKHKPYIPESKWPWWMPNKIELAAVIAMIVLLGYMMHCGFQADARQKAEYIQRGQVAQQRSRYVCIAHGGVVYMTKEFGHGDTNYIAICNDGQRFDNLQNMMIGGSR